MRTGSAAPDRRFFALASAMSFLGVVLLLTRQGHEELFVVVATALFVGAAFAMLRGARYWPFRQR
ncbi:hypothetical protein GCM10025783_08430 [Amnibacterium soli]|uniref:Uncharacterized protein n=1 Tax=Amnibacterium soli TaxID=1282736 RepID=A0ABP8YWP2_9MICO